MGTKAIKQINLPVSSLANARTLKVIHYGDPKTDCKAYIQAGLHADEAPGFVVMHHLINLFDETDAADKIDGHLVLVPVANPIGIGQWRVQNLQHGWFSDTPIVECRIYLA